MPTGVEETLMRAIDPRTPELLKDPACWSRLLIDTMRSLEEQVSEMRLMA